MQDNKFYENGDVNNNNYSLPFFSRTPQGKQAISLAISTLVHEKRTYCVGGVSQSTGTCF